MIRRPTLPDLRLIERHFQRLQNRVAPSHHSSDVSVIPSVEFKKYMFDLSLELTTEFLLGEDINRTSPENNLENSGWSDAFVKEFENAFQWISKRERLKAFYWLVDGLEFRRSCNAARALVDEMVLRSIEKRKMYKMPAETYIALEPLLSTQTDTDMIRDQFINFLLAGRDTSGALLSWVFYVLAREPDLVAILRKEVESILGLDRSRMPSKSELGSNSMVKLDQFINESEYT